MILKPNRWHGPHIFSLLIGCFVVTSPVSADTGGSPLGPQIAVASDNASAPAVAKNANGNFVVAWSVIDPQSGLGNIFSQRYAADGTPQGAPQAVRSSLAYQTAPKVAMDDAGDFVVAWIEGQASSTYGQAYLQFYAADGAPRKGPVFLAGAIGPDPAVSVSMNGNGDTVATWSNAFGALIPVGTVGLQVGDASIWMKRYAVDGTSRGAAKLVTNMLGQLTVTRSSDIHSTVPVVAVDGTGAFVVAWAWTYSFTGGDVYARRYSDAGTPIGAAFKVNTLKATGMWNTSIAANASGAFVIGWAAENPNTQNNQYDTLLYARRYDSSGVAQGAEANVGEGLAETIPSLSLDAAGDFVVAWEGMIDPANPDSGNAVYIRRFGADGQPLALSYAVVTDTSGMADPAVSSDAAGNFVVVWNVPLAEITPPTYSLLAQQFSAP